MHKPPNRRPSQNRLTPSSRSHQQGIGAISKRSARCHQSLISALRTDRIRNRVRSETDLLTPGLALARERVRHDLSHIRYGAGVFRFIPVRRVGNYRHILLSAISFSAQPGSVRHKPPNSLCAVGKRRRLNLFVNAHPEIPLLLVTRVAKLRD